MRLHLFSGAPVAPAGPTRRRLLTGLALTPLAIMVPGCANRLDYCQVTWYAGPNEACFEHDFLPGDAVMSGLAEAGEHEVIVRNRLAADVLTPEQQAVIFDLLLMEVDGELVSFDQRGGYHFIGGEEVVFRLMDFEFIVDVDAASGEGLDQLELFDDSVVISAEADSVPNRSDPNDLGYELGFVVIRGGAVHEPGPEEFIVDVDGIERFQVSPGDRLVYLSLRYLPAAA